jgi:hypothetical protein
MTATSTPRRTFSRRDVAVLQKESPPFGAREDVNCRESAFPQGPHASEHAVAQNKVMP